MYPLKQSKFEKHQDFIFKSTYISTIEHVFLFVCIDFTIDLHKKFSMYTVSSKNRIVNALSNKITNVMRSFCVLITVWSVRLFAKERERERVAASDIPLKNVAEERCVFVVG